MATRTRSQHQINEADLPSLTESPLKAARRAQPTAKLAPADDESSDDELLLSPSKKLSTPARPSANLNPGSSKRTASPASEQEKRLKRAKLFHIPGDENETHTSNNGHSRALSDPNPLFGSTHPTQTSTNQRPHSSPVNPRIVDLANPPLSQSFLKDISPSLPATESNQGLATISEESSDPFESRHGPSFSLKHVPLSPLTPLPPTPAPAVLAKLNKRVVMARSKDKGQSEPVAGPSKPILQPPKFSVSASSHLTHATVSAAHPTVTSKTDAIPPPKQSQPLIRKSAGEHASKPPSVVAGPLRSTGRRLAAPTSASNSRRDATAILMANAKSQARGATSVKATGKMKSSTTNAVSKSTRPVPSAAPMKQTTLKGRMGKKTLKNQPMILPDVNDSDELPPEPTTYTLLPLPSSSSNPTADATPSTKNGGLNDSLAATKNGSMDNPMQPQPEEVFHSQPKVASLEPVPLVSHPSHIEDTGRLPKETEELSLQAEPVLVAASEAIAATTTVHAPESEPTAEDVSANDPLSPIFTPPPSSPLLTQEDPMEAVEAEPRDLHTRLDETLAEESKINAMHMDLFEDVAIETSNTEPSAQGNPNHGLFSGSDLSDLSDLEEEDDLDTAMSTATSAKDKSNSYSGLGHALPRGRIPVPDGGLRRSTRSTSNVTTKRKAEENPQDQPKTPPKRPRQASKPSSKVTSRPKAAAPAAGPSTDPPAILAKTAFSRPTASSMAKYTPKSPVKPSASGSPNKKRSTSLTFPLKPHSSDRPTLQAGTSLSDLSAALARLKKAAPERPNTSLGFNDDAVVAELPGISKDDNSVGVSGSSDPGLPYKPTIQRSIFPILRGGATAGRLLTSNRGRMGPKVSRMPTLPAVIGSPTKGGQAVDESVNEDVEVLAGATKAEEPTKETADVFGPLPAETPNPPAEEESLSASRRASTAFDVIQRAAANAKKNEVPLPPPRKKTVMGPPLSPPRRSSRQVPRLASYTDLDDTPAKRSNNGAAQSTVPGAGAGAHRKLKAKEKGPSLDILKDCVIFVDVRGDDGREAGDLFVNMLEDLGARLLNSFGTTCTHIVFKDGAPGTVAKYRAALEPKPCMVGIGWVVDCAEKMMRVEEEPHLVDVESLPSFLTTNKRRKSTMPLQMSFEFTSTGLENEDNTNESLDVPMSDEHNLTPLERARQRRLKPHTD